MAPVARTRNVVRSSLHGYVKDKAGAIVATSIYDDERSDCYDFWKKEHRKTPPLLKGMLPATDFQLAKYTSIPIHATRTTGTIRFDRFAAQYNGICADGGEIFKARGSSARNDENNLLTIKLLERTNPFRSEFSVPVFIKELVEISSLFQFAAKSFAGYVGGQYLNYRFGWVQFVRDVKTLSDISTALERRVRELISLQKHGGLRRNIALDSKALSGSIVNFPTNSTWGFQCRVTLNWHKEVKFRGSIRWVPTRDFSEDLRRLGVINLAFRKVFDLEKVDPETLWNLIPWSWLIDYFADIGGYLAATNGSAKLIPYDVCIMREYTAKDRGIRSSTHAYSVEEECQYDLHLISRDVVTAISFPGARFDLLNANQWKVILALFLRLVAK